MFLIRLTLKLYEAKRMDINNTNTNVLSAIDEKKRQKNEARRLANEEKKKEKKRQQDEVKRLENLWIEDFERRKEEIRLIQEELSNLKRIRYERVRDLDCEIEILEKKCEELSKSKLKCPHRRTSREPAKFRKIEYTYHDIITCKLCQETWDEYEFVAM